MDLENLRKTLLCECGLKKGDVLLVGVSGGPDSLCLLHVLNYFGYRLIAAHLDHALRPESQAEALHVEELVRRMGLPFVSERQDIANYAHQEKLSIEEAARLVRYGFLYTQACLKGASAVVVAHTADDQVETVLMHLLRGAGLSGLKGMTYRVISPEWNKNIPLVRPLLNVWHKETLAYCQEHDLNVIFDSSNTDVTYFRNRLRLELIPYLEEYNPKVKEIIRRMAQSLVGDHEIVQETTNKVLKTCLISEGMGYSILDALETRKLPRGLQRNLYRQVVSKLRPNLRDVSFYNIERMVDFIASPTRSRQVELFDGLSLLLDANKIVLLDEGINTLGSDFPQMHPAHIFTLTVPGESYFINGWSIESEFIESPTNSQNLWQRIDQKFHAWMDGEKVEFPLIIRTRRPGDRLQPLGMDGKSLKLSDYFINVKIPRLIRDNMPLVCSSDDIVWVPGLRLAHFCQVRATTRRILHLRLVRN